MKKLVEKALSMQAVRFIIAGGLSTGVDYVIYYIMSHWILIEISKGLSMISASVFSYFFNKTFTFHCNDHKNIRYLFRFYAVFAANFFVNLIVNSVIYHCTGLKNTAFIMATLAGMTINYVGQRFLVFV